jgi:endonuclease/exonuclease/phosphatase family metal-dependent hydrolase
MRLALALLGGAAVLAAPLFINVRHSEADGPDGLKVMTFNIQHGIGDSHKYNLQHAIDTIARIQPDLVGLQEVTRNHPYYDCDDQPARIAAGLKAATGKTWSVVYEQEWFTPNVECQKAGKGDGKETEGLAFFSPAPLGASSMTKLPFSRIALTIRPASAGGLPVTVTHLSNGKNNGPQRAAQVEALVKLTEKLGPAQLLMGDFNLSPEEGELQPLLTPFRDAWAAALQNGGSKGAGNTHGGGRIDFIFYKGDGIAVTGMEAVETAGWFGAAASDHRPTVATVRLPRVLK